MRTAWRFRSIFFFFFVGLRYLDFLNFGSINPRKNCILKCIIIINPKLILKRRLLRIPKSAVQNIPYRLAKSIERKIGLKFYEFVKRQIMKIAASFFSVQSMCVARRKYSKYLVTPSSFGIGKHKKKKKSKAVVALGFVFLHVLTGDTVLLRVPF